MNIYSLQAYSLSSKLCISMVENTQFLCPLLTSQSLPLCTRMAPRSWPQHTFLACISSLTCASCRPFLLPWCKPLPGKKIKTYLSLTPTRLFVSLNISKPVQWEMWLKGRGWEVKCHVSTLKLIKATEAFTETETAFPIHTKKWSEVTSVSDSVLNLFQSQWAIDSGLFLIYRLGFTVTENTVWSLCNLSHRACLLLWSDLSGNIFVQWELVICKYFP